MHASMSHNIPDTNLSSLNYEDTNVNRYTKQRKTKNNGSIRLVSLLLPELEKTM